MFETGRICLKTAGREAGKLCVVLDKVDNDFVLVTGPKVFSGVKKRKCNMSHLEPLDARLKVKADSSDEDILELIKKEDKLLKKFNLSVPSPDDIKKWESQKSEKEKFKAEKAKTEQLKKKEETKKSAPTLSDLAAENAKLTEKSKETKPLTISDMATENRKLIEADKKKKETKKEQKK